MESSVRLLLCFILLTSRWTLSQETDCLTGKARKGRCVSIAICPALLEIARKSVISDSERQYLTAHICGYQKVCCEKPSGKTSATSTSSTTSATTTASANIPDNDNKEFQALSLLPNKTICGLDSAGFRIIEGAVTNKEQYRWMVALDFNLPKKKGVRCGGSLINRRYVLTAAHCVASVREQDLKLRLGEWDIYQDPDCEQDDSEDCNPRVKYADVNRIIIHPGYTTRIHDIALLKMADELPKEYESHILPICMPLSTELMKDSFTNRNVTVVGWGRNENRTASRYKMQADITTISNQKCEEELGVHVRDSNMCAKSSNSTYRDACDGDSGGPLQIQIHGTYYLIGIISHGPRCGQTTLPAVYTRITFYVNWILKNITE